MVHLQKIRGEFPESDVFVFVIAMHPEVETARRLTRELGVTYPVFSGHGSKLGERYAYG
jgi:hypothetical protein